MANIPETPNFDTGVYQIETTDQVLGGPDGKINVQAKQLANRTAYLKAQVEAAAGVAADAETKATSALAQIGDAEAAMGAAADSAAEALAHKNAALAAKALAEAAKTAAEAAQSGAAAAQTGAAADRVVAGQKAAEAQSSATTALNANTAVQAAKAVTLAARDEAVAAQDAVDADRIAAEAARVGAEAALNAFNGRYYGAAAADPSADPLGNPPGLGDLYYNTVVNEFRAFDGTNWRSGSGSVTNQQFTGTGSATAFTLAVAPGGASNTQVYINGTYQQKAAYTVSGTTLTFSEAPASGDKIEVIVISTKAIGSTTSGLVQFIQSGTGAVERTVEGKLRDVVSVKDFGAKGDGTTDDGPAIMAAINSLPAYPAQNYGGVVDLGAGTFLTANTKITIPRGVWLRGRGPSATTIKAGASFNQTAIIANQYQDGTQEYAFVSDLTVSANKAAGAVCSVAAVDFVSLFVNSGLFNVVVENSSSVGIHFGASNGAGPVLADNCWVINSGSHGFLLDASVSSLNACSGYNLRNCTSEHQASGKSAVYIQGNGKLSLVSIRDLHVEQANTGAGTYGITLDGATDVIVDGAQIQSASASSGGILITNHASNVRFRFQNITNINVITSILTDQKNNVTFGAVTLPYYAAPDVGLFPNKTQTATYSASITPDLALGNHIIIVVTNTTAFTINPPINAVDGMEMTLEIVNTSGGAMGAITWAYPDLFYNSWSNPANTKRKTIQFRRRSGAWVQVGAISPDM